MGRTVRKGHRNCSSFYIGGPLAHLYWWAVSSFYIGGPLCMCACICILESTVLWTAREYQTLSKRTLSYAALEVREHKVTIDKMNLENDECLCESAFTPGTGSAINSMC